MAVVDALLAVANSDRDAAMKSAAAVSKKSPESDLASALLSFLKRGADSGVYQEPSSFQTFIDNGDNPALYSAVIDHLVGIHSKAKPRFVADIGCGDGRVTAGVLHSSGERVDLVEPSADLLNQATDRPDWPSTNVVPHPMAASEYVSELAADDHLDLVQSTFALHTIAPHERSELVTQLAKHTDHVVVVEFDVPGFADRSEAHAAYTCDRFQKGIAEYVDHPEVIDGFLMSVLVAQFDPSQKRHTFEGPSTVWSKTFEAAGFQTTITPLFDYWWAPAFALEATLP